MLFLIYHPKGGALNDGESLDIDFEPVAVVEAKDFNEAFFRAQNDFSIDYRNHNVRSTCVGDIIAPVGGEAQMVRGMGFTKVPGFNNFLDSQEITLDQMPPEIREQFE